MERVILLNADYSFLSTISWQKAIKLLVKGKVEVLKATERIIATTSKLCKIVVPKVLRLIKLIRCIYKEKVPFSKRNILIRDNFTCQYCGHESEKMTIDHVIPISRGGKNSFDNCVASCKKCNNVKNDRTPIEAKMFLKRLPTQPTISEFIGLRMRNMGIDSILQEIYK